MRLLLIWGAEFGRSLLLGNYLGLWVLTHVLFGQWNVFDPTVRGWNAPTPPTPSWRSLPLQKHICSHFIPWRAASEIITADAMRGTGGGSRREGFLFDPSLQLLSLGPKYLLSLFCFYPENTSLRLRLRLWSASISRFLRPRTIGMRSLCANSGPGRIYRADGVERGLGEGLREGLFGSSVRITSSHTSWVSSFNVLR